MANDRGLPLPVPLTLRRDETRTGEGGAANRAVTDLFQRTRPTLLAYAYRLLGSFPDAEDVVQTAFLRLFTTLQREGEITDLRRWIYKVLHNLAVDQLRRQGSQEWLLRAWRPGARAGSRVTSLEGELIQRQIVERALERLNERERHCLLLRTEGLTYREIGDVLGISEKAVSVYIARGLRRFEPEHDDR